jgi:hypothetical protein
MQAPSSGILADYWGAKRHSDTKAEPGDGGILARGLGVAILAGGLSVRYFHHLAEQRIIISNIRQALFAIIFPQSFQVHISHYPRPLRFD